MPVTLNDELAEAALRAAAKAGFSNVVEGLIEAGVNPDAMLGAALTVAERYGDPSTIAVLRRATTDRGELYKQAEERVSKSG